MKKIAFILALVMVMTVALVACGDKPEESKPAESVEASVEESVEESKPAESVEESVDKSSEEPADESSEEPADESSEEEVSVPASDGTNIALGKNYTVDTGSVSGVYNANLTDGKAYDVAISNALDPEDNLCYWWGFNASNTVDGFASVTVDLGEAADINTVRVHTGVLADWGVNAWKSYKFSVSTDGTNFTDVGTLPQGSTEDGTYWVEKGFAAVNARYVKVTMELSPAWSFINEIEVIAAE